MSSKTKPHPKSFRNSSSSRSLGNKKVYRLCKFHHKPPLYPNYVFSGRVSDLNLDSFRPQRAGVIPYIVQPGPEKHILFSLGVDAKYFELTDFGGGVSYKKDGTALEGALREFSEESLGVFGTVDRERLSTCFVVYNREMMIIFIPFDVNPDEKSLLFHKRLPQETEPEVSDILWLSEAELKIALKDKSRILYVRVRKLLSKAGDFCSFLKE